MTQETIIREVMDDYQFHVIEHEGMPSILHVTMVSRDKSTTLSVDIPFPALMQELWRYFNHDDTTSTQPKEQERKKQ